MVCRQLGNPKRACRSDGRGYGSFGVTSLLHSQLPESVAPGRPRLTQREGQLRCVPSEERGTAAVHFCAGCPPFVFVQVLLRERGRTRMLRNPVCLQKRKYEVAAFSFLWTRFRHGFQIHTVVRQRRRCFGSLPERRRILSAWLFLCVVVRRELF